jgi:tetratricopeptide (TPR) repeat protein
MLSLRQNKPAGTKNTKQDLEFEIHFLEGVVHRIPDYIEALQILGDAYTKTGQWEKGLKVDRRLARLCPDNALVFYNLACSYSLLKNLNSAFTSLRKAIRLGYDDARWLARDPDLKNLREDPRYTSICKKLKKSSA